MAYSIETFPEFEEDYKRLCSKNRAFKNEVDNKIRQICNSLKINPNHYKPLGGPLTGLRRVHIGGSFVLLFKVVEPSEIVKLVKLEHHDKAYKV